MMLAQMLMPSQAGTGTLNPTASGALKGSTSDAPNGSQAIDPIEESAPAFASLLTELKNLEALAEPAGGLDPNTLIKIRVATGAAAVGTESEDSGTNLPAPGKVMPDTATLAASPGLPTLPLETVDPANSHLMSSNPEREQDGLQMEIVVSEPKPSELQTTASGTTEPANARANPGGAEVAALLQAASVPPASTAATTGSAPTSTAPPATSAAAAGNTEAPLRAEGLMPTTTANGTGSSAQLSDGKAGSGEQQGERQTQANPASRGPTITFSLENTPSATQAAPTASATTTSGSAQVLSQPLTLLGQPAQWAQPLAERLAGLATRGANTAEIRLHPPSLGQLEVRITVANDQASVFVASGNPEVREALQQALPRLDDLLSGLGIELAESEIADRQAEGFQADAEGRQSADPETAAEPGAELRNEPAESRLGLLDTWA
jgi:flagellar hook-length control protein FliK